MRVYLLRHAIAEEHAANGKDADRRLTATGRKRLREMMELAGKVETKPSLILTSPYVRAVQTAEMAAEALGYPGQLLRTDALVPGADPSAAWEEIRVHRDESEILLVGHEPLFSQLIAYLLGYPSLAVDCKKASLTRIDVESFSAHPRGVLQFLLPPKLAG